MTETRARRRIRQAVESRGYQLASLEWDPPVDGGEMSGLCGGWYGTTDRPYEGRTWPGNDIMGLSVDEALAWIDTFVIPPEPCDCGFDHNPLVPVKGSPDHGLHLPTCRWHIKYRLRWWA